MQWDIFGTKCLLTIYWEVSWVEPEPARDFNKRVIMFREVCVEKYSYILTSLGNICTSTTCALLNMQSLKEEIQTAPHRSEI